MIRKHIIGVVASLLMCAGLQAQQTLTLDSCLQMALRSNLEKKSAEVQAEQYRHTQKAYLANFFPNISGRVLDAYNFDGKQTIGLDLMSFVPANLQEAFAPYTQQMQEILMQTLTPEQLQALASLDPTIGIDYKIGNVFNASVTIEQPIYMGGKITAAYKMSKLGAQMAQVNKRLTTDQVILNTNEAYALLLEATQMHEVALQYDSLLQQLMNDVTAAERHGLGSHNDVLTVQVKKSEAELQVRQAQNAILLAQMNLCRLIGLPLTEHPRVEPIEPKLIGTHADADLTGRPEYTILELKSQMSAQQVKLTRSDFLPQLGLLFDYGYTHCLTVVDQYLFNKPSATLLLNLTVPLYHANEGYHKVKAAKLEHERNLLEQKDLIEQMKLEVQQTANLLDESILELALTTKNLEQAQENLKASRKSYEVGLESLSDHLMAQTLWQDAYAKKVIAQAQVIVNIVKHQKASGTLGLAI